MNMNNFEYVEGMTIEELTGKVHELIDYVATDEYWLEFGCGVPSWDKGCGIYVKYTEEMIKRGAKKSETLSEKFNKAQHINMSRPYIINRTTNNKTKILLMSGAEYEIPINNAETFRDLIYEVIKVLRLKNNVSVNIVDGDRVISSKCPRIIITDETVLAIVLS